MFEINWKPLSKITLLDEIDFIIRKWNLYEADKFVNLVYNYLETISKTPTIGIYNKSNRIYSLVISKQTTLFYKIIEEKKQIDLLLFWNNSQNPKSLDKLLV